MIPIDSPTLAHIAKSSLINGKVELVIDDTNWKYHYLMSEQKYWGRWMIPDLRKKIIELPSDLFFEAKDWKIYDKTQEEDISAKIREVIGWNDMTQIAA